MFPMLQCIINHIFAYFIPSMSIYCYNINQIKSRTKERIFYYFIFQDDIQKGCWYFD